VKRPDGANSEALPLMLSGQISVILLSNECAYHMCLLLGLGSRATDHIVDSNGQESTLLEHVSKLASHFVQWQNEDDSKEI
jgi:hypothetical protein